MNTHICVEMNTEMNTEMNMEMNVEMNTHNPFRNEQVLEMNPKMNDGNEPEMNKEEMQRRLFNLKQMRNTYYSYRCYPRPKCSPFDKEIRELKEKLKEME